MTEILDILREGCDDIDILFDAVRAECLELSVAIEIAELAPVPGAAIGNLKKEAGCLTWRSFSYFL